MDSELNRLINGEATSLMLDKLAHLDDNPTGTVAYTRLITHIERNRAAIGCDHEWPDTEHSGFFPWHDTCTKCKWTHIS